MCIKSTKYVLLQNFEVLRLGTYIVLKDWVSAVSASTAQRLPRPTQNFSLALAPKSQGGFRMARRAHPATTALDAADSGGEPQNLKTELSDDCNIS